MLHVILLGSMAGILGTGLGGAIALLKMPTVKWMSGLMNACAGLMMAVVCFDLLPEAYALGGIPSTLLGVALGVLLMILMENHYKDKDDGLMQAGKMMLLSIALHNLPEGLAVGAGYASTPALGFGICIAIALHDVPEGIALAVPLRAGGVSAFRVFGLAILAGAPTALGAGLGYALGVSQGMIALNLGLAAGAMGYVVSGEMLPQAETLHSGIFNPAWWVLGLIAGSVLIHFL